MLKTVISRIEYELLPKANKEKYMRCGNCSNYLLKGKGTEHLHFLSVYLCTSCENEADSEVSIEGVELIGTGKILRDNNSGRVWWVFPKGTTALQALTYLQVKGLVVEGYGARSVQAPNGVFNIKPISVTEENETVVVTRSWSFVN